MAKMSEKKDPPKPSVCEHFEPQAWRKTVCKNCFQPPEKHTAAGGGSPNDSKNVSQAKEKTQVRNASANENDPPAAGSTPMTSSPEKAKSSPKSGASSIKDKYEQLERDKFKPKQPPKVAPKSKGPGGLSVKTDKPERLSGVSSAPVTPTPPEGNMERPIIPPPTLPKQPRILNIKVSDQDSGEDVKSGKVPVNKLVKSKFGSVDNVSDTEETSKVELFQRSRFGSMENITIQPKKKEPIPIPIQKSKFGGSMENVSLNDRRHSAPPQQQHNAADLLNKLDNFSIEIRSGATSNLGSTVIHQQEGGKVDIIQIPIKRTSAPSTPTAESPKSLSNKESLQNELNEKRLSKGNDMFNKQNLNKTNELKSPSDNDSRAKFAKSPSPLADRFRKLDVKSPTPEKVVKLDVKSPSSDKDTKSDFKSKFDKTDTKQAKVSNDVQNGNTNEKVDLRAGLKKKNNSNDTNKSDKVEPKSLFPTLKSTKKDAPNDNGNDKTSTSTESNSQDTPKGLKNGKPETNSISDKLSKSQSDTKVDNSTKDSNKFAKTDLKDNKDSKDKNSSVSKTKEEANSDDVVVSKNKFELPKLKSKNGSDGNGDKLPNNASKVDTNSKDNTNSLGRNKTSVLNGQKNDSKIDSNKNDSKDSSKAKLEDKNHISDKDKLGSKKPEEPKQATDDKKPAWMKTIKKDDKKSEEPGKLSKPEVKPTDSKSKFGKKEEEPNELLSKFAKKDDPKPKFGKLDQKPDTKLGKKDEAPNELLSKFAKKDDPKPKFGKPEQNKDAKPGKKEETNELLSKFAKKDYPKPKFGKLEPKQDSTSKFGKKEEEKKEKNELLSRFAKKDDPKSKQDDKKPDPKSKFGKQQDDKKPDEKKNELLSRFAKKDDNKADTKPGSKPEDKTAGRKGSLGAKDDEKSELLSRFNKKTEPSDPKSKFGKKDENKQDIKSKFGEQKSEGASPFALKTGVGKKDENKQDVKSKFGEQKSEGASPFALKTGVGKKDENKQDVKSKFGEQKSEGASPFAMKTGVGLNKKKDKPEENKMGLKSVLDRKVAIKKDKPDNQTNDSKDSKKEPTKPSWKLKLEEKAAEKNDEQKGKSKPDEKKDDPKSKFAKPELKPTKTDKDKDAAIESKPEKADLKEVKHDDSKKQTGSSVDESPKSDIKKSDIDSHSNELSKHEKSEPESTKPDKFTKETTPEDSLISENTFDISTDGEIILGDDSDACAVCSSDDSSPMHVDTQVFTSSRQNSVGVIGQEELESFAAASRIGLSDLNNSRDESETDKKLQNGDISTHIQTTDIDAVEIPDKLETKTDTKSADALEKLRLELNLMMERCSNLEKENEQLKYGLDEKNSEVRDVKRDKRDVEAAIQSLQSKVQLMEEKCTNLESDNDELSGKLKTQDQNASKPQHSNTNATNKSETEYDGNDKLTANEKYVADVVEENDTLKQEINELKLEMDEMYDSFRDQEAEEFRELQRELEITAKNCRILQFKLRKMERHGNQLEQDKCHYEEKLRQLQNTFQDRDAVSHIHALEDELRMAKDVSVRLHDELDLMEDKRGKVEEENRHLTELLEQADRKQFRLEMEVDKLRDKIVCLKQEMRQKDNPDGDKKVPPLCVSGRQESIDREMQELKRELYDCREREADMTDQLQYLQTDNKTLNKKVASLEEENERLSKQLKKMSIERALVRNSKLEGNSKIEGSGNASDIELRIQFELADKELSTLRHKMEEMEEENEMLHSDMFCMEQKLRDKDRELLTIPESSSPSVYYEDKIREYEKEADEFRSKLLQKENEIQCLYCQLSSGQIKQGKVLRKAKSLDSETDYDLLVNLRRQVEMGQQECLSLRDRIECLENENALKIIEIETLKCTHGDITECSENENALKEIEIETLKGTHGDRVECLDNESALKEIEITTLKCTHGDRIECLEKENALKAIEIETLKCTHGDRIECLENENALKEIEIETLKCTHGDRACISKSLPPGGRPTGLSTLAVAYVDRDNEVQLRKQLVEMKRADSRLCERIQHLSAKLTSLANHHCLTKTKQAKAKASISKIPKTSMSEEITRAIHDKHVDKRVASSGRVPPRGASNNSSRDRNQSFALRVVSPPTSCYYNAPSDETVTGTRGLDSQSHDPYTLLSDIDKQFCEVLLFQRACCSMETESACEIVPPEIEISVPSNSPASPNSSTGNVSRGDFEPMNDNESADDVSKDCDVDGENNKISTEVTTNSDITEAARDNNIELADNNDTVKSDISETVLDNTIDLAALDTVNSVVTETARDNNIALAENMDTVLETADNHTDQCQVDNKYSQKYGNKSGTDIIDYLEDQIDDLRLIIKSKEEKNLSLEEDVRSLEAAVRAAQDDSRRRELELLTDMDLIHGRNEILSNLLEIVRERAETAEDDLDRLLGGFREKGESSDSSEKTTPLGEISDGSDDVFDGSPAERVTSLWEEQFKKRICSLETLLAEERKKASYLQKKLELNGSDVISSAMSDDAKLHQREKELLQSELQESQRHAIVANDQIRSLTEKLKKADAEKHQSPIIHRKQQTVSSSSDEYEDAKERLEPFCKTCSELQSVKDQLCEELYRFKDKAEELEGKVEEVNAIWVTKNGACEKEKLQLEQKLKQKLLDCKKLEESLGKLREEDRMKDIFLKERDNNLKDKMSQISRKDELIQEQEDIIRQREEDMQQLFDQISQREKNIKEMHEKLGLTGDKLKDTEDRLEQLTSFIDEKNDELHYMEEEMQETNKKRKESETMLAELKDKLDETFKTGHTELETENERLQADVDNLMTNIAQLHNDKCTLQTELDKSKQALSEAMLMWDKDRSTLGSELSICREKQRTFEVTAKKTEPQAVQSLRKEVHTIIETKEKIALQALLSKIEHDNTVRLLKADKFKLTEELTSKIRMLTHEMTNNDKMADELSQLRGQDDINYQLHHHEKLLRAEYMAMKVRYETQLERLQKEHLQLLEHVERLQREKNLDTEIITGIQKSMSNIKETYTYDLSRWNGERGVLESHIKQIEEGRDIATHLRAQIDALKQQLSDQDIARTELINRMTSERQGWDIEKATLNSNINQLEEQLAVFVQAQSKCADTQYRMEIAWEKERSEQNRLLAEAHGLAMDLQNQLQKRDEEHTREKKNLLEQLDKHRKQYDSEKNNKERVELEVTSSESKIHHLEKQLADFKEKARNEEDGWMREKGGLLRRLAEMRKTHQQDSRRIEDVLAALKRLRELAAIVMESENSATLPSNGTDGAAATGDASAASADVTSGEGDMGDLKQNIDQIILKYVKEQLRQIHLATEELAKPPIEVTREERQKIRRSLSSSEIDLLKDEFLLGPQDPERLRTNGMHAPPSSGNNSGAPTRDNKKTITRMISHDGTGVASDHLPSDYIENILTEQSTFYKDEKDQQVEVHRVKSQTETTRVETTVTSLPKPPRSFVIPRSRSTSPGPGTIIKTKRTCEKPIIKSVSVDTSHANRLSTPISSSADSSPIRIYPTFIPSTSGESSLPAAGTLTTGSLDRLSPAAARKRFFEQQPVTSDTYLSWPERHKKEQNENRNSKSLSDNDLCVPTRENGNAKQNVAIRSSVSMDDSAMSTGLDDIECDSKLSGKDHGKHSALRDMFKTMKKKFRPKVKRSHSAREYDRSGKVGGVRTSTDSVAEETGAEYDEDERHVVQERMTPIDIPSDSPDVSAARKSRQDANTKKDRSRSPKGRGGEKEEHSSESTLQRLKKRFRSKSADRAEDRHVTPILVGRSSGSQNDNSWQYSETCV